MLDEWREGARRIWDAFAAAWKARHDDATPKRTRLEAAFLPPALEIQENPPSPTARMTMWFLAALLLVGLAWAILGKVDVVVVATGKIIPDSRIKTVQAATAGIIREIRVADGDNVEKNQILFVMDPTGIDASIEQVSELIRAARLSAAMHGLLARRGETGTQLQPPHLDQIEELKDLPPERLRQLQLILDETLHAHNDARAQIEKEIAALREAAATQAESADDAREMLAVSERLGERQIATEQAQINKIQLLLPLAKEDFEAFERLHRSQVVSKLKKRQAEEKYISLREDLVLRRNQLEQAKVEAQAKLLELEQRARRHRDRIQEIQADIETKKETAKRLQSEFRQQHLQEQENRNRDMRSQIQELVKLEKDLESHSILSPAAGAVQQLALHTEGAVVQASQALLVVVPENPILEIEAVVQNKDVGFVQLGQAAEVKVDTFPYTKYGLLEGEVLRVAADAVENEGLGLVYLVRVRLKQSSVSVDGRSVPLAPGMSVSAEIKIGKRRVIEFFLAPLLRAGKESLRER